MVSRQMDGLAAILARNGSGFASSWHPVMMLTIRSTEPQLLPDQNHLPRPEILSGLPYDPIRRCIRSIRRIPQAVGAATDRYS
jgi:hypothetical protein